MPSYDYDYFCGANITVSINDVHVDEIVGITYRVQDSATPIWGYSSRLFDAVAPGQKLIQGSFVINFRRPNYIYDAFLSGQQVIQQQILDAIKGQIGGIPDTPAAGEVHSRGAQEKIRQAGGEVFKSGEYKEIAESLKYTYWGPPDTSRVTVAKDVTLIGPGRIQMNFGGSNRFSARTTKEIHGVYIIGEGSAIQIDENVILEEYNFFGRELVSFTYEPLTGQELP